MSGPCGRQRAGASRLRLGQAPLLIQPPPPPHTSSPLSYTHSHHSPSPRTTSRPNRYSSCSITTEAVWSHTNKYLHTRLEDHDTSSFFIIYDYQNK